MGFRPPQARMRMPAPAITAGQAIIRRVIIRRAITDNQGLNTGCLMGINPDGDPGGTTGTSATVTTMVTAVSRMALRTRHPIM